MYDLTYIVKPTFTDAEVKVVVKKVADLIGKNGGSIIEEKILDKRRLMYPIKKQSYGFYVTQFFKSEPQSIFEIDNAMRHDVDVLRHLIIEGDSHKTVAKGSLKPAKKKATKDATKTSVSFTKEKEKEVSAEDLDKRLEEILEE